MFPGASVSLQEGLVVRVLSSGSLWWEFAAKIVKIS